ncbi:iron-containing alcohol dehydrogenase [Bacillus licheniformis]|nr:iron-containing alcohol dehydrogenase [Bacillus licheniformis]
MNGVDMMAKFQPDVIIALGGGSAMDAAKECGCSTSTLMLNSLA